MPKAHNTKVKKIVMNSSKNGFDTGCKKKEVKNAKNREFN